MSDITSVEKKFISVQKAEEIIVSQRRDFGTETICFREAIGRVLAQSILADRDLPPFDRVAMDGIAVSYEAIEKGIKSFRIKATQAAGEIPVEILAVDHCIEIMTGAALPSTTDTVIRYEDIEIENGEAFLRIEAIKKGQNIHWKASDKKEGEVLVDANSVITPSIVNAVASVGAKDLMVKKLPKVIVVSTGDEIIDIDKNPLAYQIRNSNAYSLEAVLKQYSIQPSLLHLPDDEKTVREKIWQCLNDFDVLILSGGVSMGKFDYIPKALDELQVKKLFYKVQQRPGKPFWFGKFENKLIFAFPGNPVSAFLCLHRYFLPWLKNSLSIPPKNLYAILEEDVQFKPSLTYFLQVKLVTNGEGQLLAQPIKGNGSGDFSSLAEADAFLELPSDRDNFRGGEVYKAWSITKTYF
ncbi:MAG TPA: molybdopterin molybdotransferase MoeA [Flavisolibacter sp.]|jgi:molybdopterin molybdotransferase|nr:molybdopterin molybdotransferase MoeA [Flavisolibacter sp.]